MITQVGYSTVRRSGGQVTSCVVCTVYLETRSAGFLIAKPWWTVYQWFDLRTTGMVCQWFGLKTTGMVYPGLTLKSVATISPGLGSKRMVGFLVEPQNQGGGGFSSLCFKTAATVW
jgi:hypothetical protein